MSKADDVFVKQFLTIVGVLVLFTISMVVLARVIYTNQLEKVASQPAAVSERIQPVGQVNTKK